MACIRKRRGKWVIDYRDITGRRRWKTVGGTRKQAEEEFSKTVSSKKAEEDKRTLEEYAKDWLEVHKVNIKKSTYWEYESVIRNHLIPAFGKVPFVKIDREMVKRLVAQNVDAGLSKSMVRNIVVPLREMFNHAIDDKKSGIETNPAERVGRFSRKAISGKKIDPLTREELAELLTTTREVMPHYYPLLLCAARTGMRAGELAALKWRNIDFQNRFIEVQGNISRGDLTTPKNGKTRKVDMSMHLTNVLDALLAEHRANAKRANPLNPEKALGAVMDSFVFTRDDGKALDPNDLRRQILYKALDAAIVRRVRFHDLRHTYASLLIAQGEDLAYIKDQLGHYSIQMTVDIYGHLVPGRQPCCRR